MNMSSSELAYGDPTSVKFWGPHRGNMHLEQFEPNVSQPTFKRDAQPVPNVQKDQPKIFTVSYLTLGFDELVCNDPKPRRF